MNIYYIIGMILMAVWAGIMLTVVIPKLDEISSKVDCYIIAVMPMITFSLGFLGGRQ